MAKYDYLLDASGKLIITKDYHDIYIELRVDGQSFYVPVSLPRRRPELQFDLINPGDDLWTYLNKKIVYDMTLEDYQISSHIHQVFDSLIDLSY